MKKINLFNNKISRKFPSREGWRVAPAGVWFAALVALFIATPSFAEPSELDKKTVASKAYVDTKQDIIETDVVDYTDPDDGGEFQFGTLVSYDETDGLVGNKIGVYPYVGLSLDSLGDYIDLNDDTVATQFDSYVPTARAVAKAFQGVYDTFHSLPWSNIQSTAINAYNTTFGTGTNNWAGYSGDLIKGQFLANSLALKQNKIPAGTAGNVVTYSGTAGTVGSVATANAPTYNETTGVLENGTNIATIAAVDTRQKKMTCAGWDSETHTDEHCWLWSIE